MNILVTIVTNASEREKCYTIRRLVFVEEQQVPLELELDDYDDTATHFLATDTLTGQPSATARLLDKGHTAKIGRVAVLQNLRGQGIGLRLMESVLSESKQRGYRDAVLDSQTYAIPFYERLGFVAEGEEFDDAGIPHYRMQRLL